MKLISLVIVRGQFIHMNKILRYIFSTLAFLLIGIILFNTFTHLLTHKYGIGGEALKDKIKQIDEMENDEVDILYLGPSKVVTGIVPSQIWKSSGYTGYNLASSQQPPLGSLHLLKYALKTIKPKALLFEFRYLNLDSHPDLKNNTTAYKHVEAALSIDSRSTMNFLSDIEKYFNDTEYTNQNHPFYAFHSRWKKLEQKDFYIPPKSFHDLGVFHVDRTKEVKFNHSIYNEPAIYIKEMDNTSINIYEEILKICNENNIRIIAIIPPIAHISEETYKLICSTREFCDSKNIDFIDTNIPEEFNRIKLDEKTDFYNGSHVNLNGSYKLSKYLAARLKELKVEKYQKSDSQIQNYEQYYSAYLSDLQEAKSFILDLPK